MILSTAELIVFAVELLALYPLFLGSEPIRLIWDDDCGSCADWVSRFQRFDLLRVVEPVGKKESGFQPGDIEQSMHVVHCERITKGFAAVTRILEHLVPTLWVAPVLRLPGIAHVGERWYEWQARRRSCPV